jgi:GTPase SAR1 family protein
LIHELALNDVLQLNATLSHSRQSHLLPTSAGATAVSTTALPAGQAQPSNVDASDASNEDARFQAAYAEVLKSSGRPFSFTQLCLVGEGRAGKTSLANSLCGRSFVQTDSTIGVGLEQMQVTQVDLQVAAAGRWTVLPQSDGHAGKFADDQLAWAIAQELEGRQGSSSGSIADIIRVSQPQSSFDFADDALVPSSLADPEEPVSVIPVPSSISSLASSSSAAAESVQFDSNDAHDQAHLSVSDASAQPSPSTQAQSSSSFADASAPVARLDKQLVLQRSREEEPLRINLLDFGGQKAFYSLHSLYLTRNSVYLLVFNMQWLVGAAADEVGQDGMTKRASCFSYLTFWLNSIYLHAKAADGSVAPILLVGTHGDIIRSPTEHEAISSMIHEKFKASPAFNSVVSLKQGTVSSGRGLLWFFPVDNKKSSADECTDKMKAAVQDCLKKEEYLKRKVPLPWLQALDAIQATKQSHVSLDLVMSIAQQKGLPVTQLPLEDEVLRMLKYFSELGLLMHHNRPTLRHLVVLDTLRCLVNPASIVMCQHSIHMLEVHEIARSTKGSAYLRLTTEGVLDKSLLDVLWVDCKDISQEVTELMVLYGLMVPLLEKAQCPFNQYLVPSLLPPVASEAKAGVKSHCYFLFGTKEQTAIWDQRGNVASRVVALQGFCPSGLFSRLTGKIVSECQSTYNYFASQYGSCSTSARFGRHAFAVQELSGMNMIQLLVMVENPRKLVSEMSRLVQLVINEMIPSLGFISAVFDDGGCSQNFQRASVETAHFVSLTRAIKCISSGDVVLLNNARNSSLSAVDARALLQRWIPPAGLRDSYDVFLSYRWTGSFDEDLTLGLFNNLSEDVFSSSGREINVFLDKRRLQDGRNFQDDFADALLKTSMPVVILSTAALQRMVKLNADSAIDNLLLEWTLIAELLHSKTIERCLPIIIGTYNSSAPSCSAVIADFLRDVVKAADGSVFYSGVDSLPDVSVTSIISKVRLMLQQHHLPESPGLSTHTVRSVVKHLSLHQAVFASNLFQDPKFQDVPASHAKEEVTRTVVEHCSGKIRSMLESIEAAKAQQSQSQPGESRDDDAADLAYLVEMLSRAKVVPATKRHDFARKLLDRGVSTEQAIWDSLCADPPELDLINDIGMMGSQKRSLDAYLRDMKL